MMLSIVEYFADHSGYKCGYCQSPDTNFSHGVWAHSLTVNDYQALIDRGWRRSGKYCYKPTLDVTCCPMYTIRCNATEFKPTKSQKKVLKRFNKYLSGPDVSENHKDSVRKMSTCSDELEDCVGIEEYVEATKQPQDITINNVVKANNGIDLETQDDNDGSKIDKEAKRDKPMESQMNEKNLESNNLKIVKKGTGPDPNKSPCKKAKDLRRERKLEKLKQKGLDGTTITNNKNKEKQLEDFINEVPSDMNNRLQLRLVRTSPPSQEWLASAEETHKVYVKYQTTVHNDNPSKCTKSKFTDFLVQSPLLEECPESGPPCGYGSFHQQYLLDGKIVAVGVIDILPKCVSSVYFFYDPQYMNLTLGTYGALREIQFTRHLNVLCPDLKYYYMGFYIHSCRKMRYKGNYNPSDLVCPETYNWIPLKDCIPKLDQSPYSRLDPFIDNIDTNYPNERDIDAIKVWVNGCVKSYQAYIKNNAEDVEEINEYAKLVGAKAAKKLVLVRKA